MLLAYNFTILYRKGLENVRVDILSRQQEYSRKLTERPRVILRERGDGGIEYNYKLLAIISIIENRDLE